MKIRLDDGTELFYTVDDFTDPWTEPETVLMHHGNGQEPQDVVRLGANYRPPLPGHSV